MTLKGTTALLNDMLNRRAHVLEEDLRREPLKYVEMLVTIREALGDNITLYEVKDFKQAIAVLIKLDRAQIKARLKAHRKMCIYAVLHS